MIDAKSEKERIIRVYEHIQRFITNLRNIRQRMPTSLTDEQENCLENFIKDHPDFVKTIEDMLTWGTESGGMIGGFLLLELERYEKQYPHQFGDLLPIKTRLENMMQHEIDEIFSIPLGETEPRTEITLEPEPKVTKNTADTEESQLENLLRELGISSGKRT